MPGPMVMLYRPGFSVGFDVGRGPKVALDETFVKDVTVTVGVGLGEVETAVPEAVVTLFPVVDPPVVELALGDDVAERDTEFEVTGVGVVLEPFFRIASSTLDKRFFRT